jgi:hypothetical protein
MVRAIRVSPSRSDLKALEKGEEQGILNVKIAWVYVCLGNSELKRSQEVEVTESRFKLRARCCTANFEALNRKIL